MKTIFQHSPKFSWAMIGTLVLTLLLFDGQLLAQAVRATVSVNQEEDDRPANDKYAGGAPLKTDPDLMDRLKKAEEYRRDGNFRVASRLWQSVLGESGDILYSDDDETYYALNEQVESILATLPPNGLSSYRIGADAGAQELLAQSEGEFDLDKLTQVVKSYFMSSVGDEAAYKLGCIYLDRYDFVGAVRLFRKITDRYPDPTVPMDQVWIKIAIAYIYVGDRESAESALSSAVEAGADVESNLYESVTRLMQESPQLDTSQTAGATWQTRLGNLRRFGVMPSLPEQYDGQPLRADWQYYFTPKAQYRDDSYLGDTVVGFDSTKISDSISSSEENLVDSWRTGNWRPAGTLLFDEQRIVFRTGCDVTVWNRQGELESTPAWRPLWLNQFQIDDASAAWQAIYNNGGGNRTVPGKNHEIQMFGDQIAQAMSIHRGVLYCVEGKHYDWNGVAVSTANRNQYGWGSIPRRTRTNKLAAYDLSTGKILWRLPELEMLKAAEADHQKKVENTEGGELVEEFDDIGFMAAPIGFGELLLVPVNVTGSIWLYALDSQDTGRIVWKSYLCDEPSGGAQPWSPIHISIEGSTAYVNCGTGVVFAMDPMTGTIRFARRYSRTGKKNSTAQQWSGHNNLLELDGWLEDLVIPYGNDLIVMASDYSAVWAIDRQTAKFRWKTENKPFGNKFDYLIGIYDDYLYLGGTNSIAAISIKAEGRWEWVHNISEDESLGRALLTEDGVYVPLREKIIKLGLKGNDGLSLALGEMKVRLGTKAPLGSLFSDGNRIWVLGGNRLYALSPDDGKEPGDSEPQTEADLESD